MIRHTSNDASQVVYRDDQGNPWAIFADFANGWIEIREIDEAGNQMKGTEEWEVTIVNSDNFTLSRIYFAVYNGQLQVTSAHNNQFSKE